jgi:hypothetical protein
MNLRDQLLKAGLVTKGQAANAAQQKRKEEKAAQGNQLSRAEQDRLEAEERTRREAAREAELAERRRRSREAQEAEAAVLRSRQILRSNALKLRSGPQRFYHRSPDGRHAWRLWLPERVAEDLRRGRLAVCWCDDARADAVIVEVAVAERVEAFRPGLVLFRNRGVDPDPAEQLYDG